MLTFVKRRNALPFIDQQQADRFLAAMPDCFKTLAVHTLDLARRWGLDIHWCAAKVARDVGGVNWHPESELIAPRADMRWRQYVVDGEDVESFPDTESVSLADCATKDAKGSSKTKVDGFALYQSYNDDQSEQQHIVDVPAAFELFELLVSPAEAVQRPVVSPFALRTGAGCVIFQLMGPFTAHTYTVCPDAENIVQELNELQDRGQWPRTQCLLMHPGFLAVEMAKLPKDFWKEMEG